MMTKLSAFFDLNRDENKNDNDDQVEYLSHPIEEPKHSLLQHSIEVAIRTRELLFYAWGPGNSF